jgi:hypothetical protein
MARLAAHRRELRELSIAFGVAHRRKVLRYSLKDAVAEVARLEQLGTDRVQQLWKKHRTRALEKLAAREEG